MYSVKYCVALVLIFAALAQGKVVNVKNSHSTPLIVTSGDAQYVIVANGFLALQLADDWSGSFTAIPVGAEVTEGPKTKVELSLSATGDSYSVSLVDGYNLGAKVIPNGSAACSAAVCTANVLKVCPIENQVTNSVGSVVACQNSPLVMTKLCPLAVVDDATAVNELACVDATSYIVIFT